MSPEMNYSYNITSVEKTMKLLELLVTSNGELSVAEIARKLDTHVSSADRYLLTLQEIGYVDKSPSGRFMLSDKILELSSAVIANHPLTTRYLDTMHTLAYEYNTTTHIMAFSGLNTITLHKDLQTRNISFNNAFFNPKRYHYCSAPGKLLLATLPEDQLNDYFKHCKFVRFTNTTLSNEQAVRENLELVRKNGYAVHDEEWLPGNLTLAFPLTVEGRIRGAMSLMCDVSMKSKMLSPATIENIKCALEEKDGIG